MTKGSCLCGSVRIEVRGPFERPAEACHCTQCRKHTGHFLAAVNVRRDALTIHGAQHVKWYQSSPKVRRGSCANCGSTLFWDPTIDGYQWTAVALGVFDEPTGLRIAKHTFVNDKGDYYEITDGAPQSIGF
jgi:hypothetical protein